MNTQISQNFKRRQAAWWISLLMTVLFLFSLITSMGFTVKDTADFKPAPTPTSIPISGWNPSTPLPKPIAMYAFAQCMDQAFYVIGGRGSNSNPIANVYRFDMLSSKWQSLAKLPIPLMGAAAACYEGKIYVVGGQTLDDEITASFYIYDINANTWSNGLDRHGIDPIEPTLPLPVWGAALGVWDGHLYLVGGSFSGFGIPSGLVSVYDISNASWASGGEFPCPDFPYPLSCNGSFAGWVQASQYLYLVGGYSNNSAQNVNTTMRLDMTNLNWEPGPEFQSARAGFALAASPTHLYAIGGDTNGGSFHDPSLLVEALNTDNWPNGTWSTQDVPQLPLPLLFNSAGFNTSGLLEREIIWSVGGLRQAGPDLVPVGYTLFIYDW